ncbi:MAG: DUF4055 domain-containing protein [Rhodobacter sp.]|nr:DUF4055 domain-containing protein [Rhodobacter sp.]
MAISYKHPSWQNMIYEWTMNRDCIEGETTIKRYNQAYLPIPAAFLAQPLAPDETRGQSYSYNYSSLVGQEIDDYHKHWDSRVNPNYHKIEAYQSYKTRARFPEITEKTLLAMLGIAMLNPPTVKLPLSMEYLIDNATKAGRSLESLYKLVLEEVLQTGREILVADPEDSSNNIYIVPYSAENLINWNASKEKGDDVNFDMAVLTEKIVEVTEDFELKPYLIYFCLRIDDGVFTVEKYSEKDGKEVKEEVNTPGFMGESINALPMVAIGSTDISPDVDKPPLSGISRIAIQLYQIDADMRQAEYMTCNPTLFITGISKEDTPKTLGSTVAVTLEEPDSKAFYPKTDTSALGHIRQHALDLFQEAYNMGATLIGSDKSSVESAEALHIRKSSFGASLSSVVDNAGNGIERMLKMIALWMNEDPDEVTFKPSKEFAGAKLSSQEIQVLLQAYLEGAYSLETFLRKLEESGNLQEGETAEDEIERLISQPPVSGTNAAQEGSEELSLENV